MLNPKFWLVSSIDDDPVKCQSFDSAVDMAIAVRNLTEGNETRNVFAFCFYGERCPITKGPERYIIVSHHVPPHYALFTRSGVITDVDDADGQLCSGTKCEADAGYKQLTDAETEPIDDEPEDLEELDDAGFLTEPAEFKEH